MAWLSAAQLQAMGFQALGDHVLISERASFYNCPRIRLGSHVRIDDFCVLSAVLIGALTTLTTLDST